MPDPIGGLYVLAVVIGIAIIYGAFRYAAWEEFDDQRRHARRVHLNLTKMGQR